MESSQLVFTKNNLNQDVLLANLVINIKLEMILQNLICLHLYSK